MNTHHLTIGLNSSVSEFSFLAGTNFDSVQIGDLCLSPLEDIESYLKRILMQVRALEPFGVPIALQLPLQVPNGTSSDLERIILAAGEAGITEIVASSLGAIHTIRRLRFDLHISACDFICCYCAQDASVLADMGVKKVRLSPELNYAQIAALATNVPLVLQAIVHGRITLGFLQEFSRRETGADFVIPLNICAGNGQKTLFQIHGNEIVSEHILNLFSEIPKLIDIGITDLFIDVRHLGIEATKQISAKFNRPIDRQKGANGIAMAGILGLCDLLEDQSHCNGWFHGKPGIEDF